MMRLIYLFFFKALMMTRKTSYKYYKNTKSILVLYVTSILFKLISNKQKHI